MPKMPPIPREQHSFAAETPWDRLRSAEPHRRDDETEADVDAEGRVQSLTPQRGVQDR